jgi:mannosyltransferase
VTRPTLARRSGRPALLLGALGFLISAAGSWQPSYWGDEAASVMSAERSLPSLFSMLGHIDAVHGSYYLFLHYWIGLFGASEFSTRLPSAIAIGVATAGTFVLARTLVNTRVALIAGLVFAVLPRVTYMGAEARSTAMATAIAVWAMVLLVHILRHRRETGRVPVWLWAGYAALIALGAYAFLYTILLIPVHAVAVALAAGTRAAGVQTEGTGTGRRSEILAWAAAVTAAMVMAAPIIYFGLQERGQISFLARRAQASVLDAAVYQWFGNTALAVLAWCLIALAVAALFAARRGRRADGRGVRRVLVVTLVWMLFPPIVLLVGTRLVAPMYSYRYLSMCAPAAAIAIGIGIASIRLRWVQVAAVVVVVGLALPTYLAQRGPYAKANGTDWRHAAAVVEAGAHPGDAVVFGETGRPSRKPRLALHLYPAAFEGLRDVTLDRPYTEVDWLWDTVKPLTQVTDQLTNTGRVWLLQNRGSTGITAGANVRTLEQAGFSIARSTTVHTTVVIEMTR